MDPQCVRDAPLYVITAQRARDSKASLLFAIRCQTTDHADLICIRLI